MIFSTFQPVFAQAQNLNILKIKKVELPPAPEAQNIFVWVGWKFFTTGRVIPNPITYRFINQKGEVIFETSLDWMNNPTPPKRDVKLALPVSRIRETKTEKIYLRAKIRYGIYEGEAYSNQITLPQLPSAPEELPDWFNDSNINEYIKCRTETLKPEVSQRAIEGFKTFMESLKKGGQGWSIMKDIKNGKPDPFDRNTGYSEGLLFGWQQEYYNNYNAMGQRNFADRIDKIAEEYKTTFKRIAQLENAISHDERWRGVPTMAFASLVGLAIGALTFGAGAGIPLIIAGMTIGTGTGFLGGLSVEKYLTENLSQVPQYKEVKEISQNLFKLAYGLNYTLYKEAYRGLEYYKALGCDEALKEQGLGLDPLKWKLINDFLENIKKEVTETLSWLINRIAGLTGLSECEIKFFPNASGWRGLLAGPLCAVMDLITDISVWIMKYAVKLLYIATGLPPK